VAAFVALVVATIGAFFVTQHLKVSTPLLTGDPAPVPSYINPISGGTTCRLRNPEGRLVLVSFRRMRVSFYLLHRPDDVDVYIVDQYGNVVRTLPGSGRYLPLKKRRAFVWNGRSDDGRVVPDGVYTIRVSLVEQGRTVTLSDPNTGRAEPVIVQTHAPDLRVDSVSPHALSDPGHSTVTIHYSGNQGLRPRVVIVRADTTKPLKNYAATTSAGTSVWNGTLAGGRRAPAGNYLVVLRLTDRTCDQVNSPLTAAAAPQAVVAVR
jgi:hypothetical protein